MAAEAAVVTSASLSRGHWIRPRTLLARLAIDAGLGIRHASLHSPLCVWRSMLGIRRCARRSEEAVPRGVRNALLMRAGSLAGTRGREAPRFHGAEADPPAPPPGMDDPCSGARLWGRRRARRPVPIPFVPPRAVLLGPLSYSLRGGAAQLPRRHALARSDPEEACMIETRF